MNCEGCCVPLWGGKDTFGGVGQTFCSTCWYEWNVLERRREALRQEAYNLKEDLTMHLAAMKFYEALNDDDDCSSYWSAVYQRDAAEKRLEEIYAEVCGLKMESGRYLLA